MIKSSFFESFLQFIDLLRGELARTVPGWPGVGLHNLGCLPGTVLRQGCPCKRVPKGKQSYIVLCQASLRRCVSGRGPLSLLKVNEP